jgi:hypothetical protein
MQTSPDITAPERPARARELLAMGVAALALRVALCAAALTHGGLSLTQFIELRDGEGYVYYARALRGDARQLREYDKRLFPGLPAAAAGLSLLGLPPGVAAQTVTWAAVALTAPVSAVLLRSRAVGWAMAVLTPTYVMSSAMLSNEAPTVLLSLLGLVLGLRGHPLAAGLAFGAAGVFRPVACFAALGFLASAMGARRYRHAVLCGLTALAVVALAMLLTRARFGSAMASAQTYAGDAAAYGRGIVNWPFESLVMTPLRQPTAGWKVLYVWAHVAVVLAGCVLLARRWLRVRGAGDSNAVPRWAAPWLLGNTVFVLCVGDQWGFHEFPRFIIPALPPLLWALRGVLLPPATRKWSWAWVAFAAGSLLMAYEGLSHDFPQGN